LALAIYEGGLPYEAMPETCNYMGPWRFDRVSGLLVEYYAPYNPVSVVHLIGKESARAMAGQVKSMIDQDDNPVDLNLSYSSFIAHAQVDKHGGELCCLHKHTTYIF